MTKPFAVITARSGSQRLPWKNMLPLSSKSLVEISIRHAQAAGLDAVVTSDADAILSHAQGFGALTVKRPQELSDGRRHIESIRHAVNVAVNLDPSKKGQPVVLLQPTSPFRNGNIIEKCIAEHAKNPSKVVLSGRSIHYADASGSPVSAKVWDGCVAVYPHDMIGPMPDAIIVENEHGNMLQIDTEEDYIQACVQDWRMRGCWMPFSQGDKDECSSVLTPLFNGSTVTLVARPSRGPIDQSRPVVHLNHCLGYDGGRADALIVVASKNIVKVGINSELQEVAMKAKVVIIRDFGQSEWVLANLKTSGRVIVTKGSKVQVTTGAMASMLIYACGSRVERIGFQRGVSRIPYCVKCFTDACVSEEIAMLEVSGKEVGNLSL